MDIDYLEQAIGAMLMAKVITFEANSWAFGFVDMVVKSTVFVEPESIISVVEDVRGGELHFIPVEEQH